MEKLYKAFRAFDLDEKGYITLADLLAAFQHVAPNTSREVIHRVYRELDTRGTGRISFFDFERAFRV